ncbi:hypothetical protein, partial [Vibrio sp. 1288]|uniref:hypothetical protein n=1 Tax=Vibrio sp. 1288 TaxID=3074550 RepID=UPI002965F9A1
TLFRSEKHPITLNKVSRRLDSREPFSRGKVMPLYTTSKDNKNWNPPYQINPNPEYRYFSAHLAQAS